MLIKAFCYFLIHIENRKSYIQLGGWKGDGRLRERERERERETERDREREREREREVLINMS